MIEQEMQERLKKVTELATRLLNRCEEWVRDEISAGARSDIVLSSCVTAALQTGLVMAARLGVPDKILQDMYDGMKADMEATQTPPNPPDPKAN